MNWPRAREKSIFNALLTHSEHLSLRGRQFVWTKTTEENRLVRAKRLLNRLKHPEEEECLWLFFDEKISPRIKKSIQEMIGGYVRADPIEVPAAMRTNFPAQQTVMVFSGLRVNIDAYVENRRTTVVKPPWIDGVANEGKPYVF
ncbi:hypothetical protein ACTXT7_006739 [Hymenolepis weldensis]